MDNRLSLAVVFAGATMSLALSQNRGSGCMVPFIGWWLLAIIDTWMILVACACIVCWFSVLIVMDFGLHFSFRR